MAVTWLLVMMLGVSLSHSSRVLLMPFPFNSHVNEFKHIGEGLVGKGHQVHMLMPSNFKGVTKFKGNTSKIAALEYTGTHADYLSFASEINDELLENSLELNIVKDLRENYEGVVEICYNVLESEELEKEVKALKFDLIILDAFPCTRCYMVLAYRLDIPYVSVTTQYEPWLFRAPALPSFVPFPFHEPYLTPKMSFWERLSNAWWLVEYSARTGDMVFTSDEFVTKYAPNKPQVTLNHLAGKSLLWLFDTDISIDFPRPMMPNEINIGGLSAMPAKPLSQELEKFVAGAKGGVIIASFGSSTAIPRKYLLKMLEAFQMLSSDVRVVMKWSFEDKPKVAENIHLMDWVPQADILGHDNTKLFITHCGANSQFEGLYHGVPMINFPAYGDQPYNAKRGDYHGVSETLRVKAFTSKQLYDAVMKVLNTDSYRENIKRASAVFHSHPQNPRERAAFWVDHVLQHGGQHLHAHALDMPAHEYLMLDILALLVSTFLATLIAIYCACSLVCRRYGGNTNKVKTQ